MQASSAKEELLAAQSQLARQQAAAAEAAEAAERQLQQAAAAQQAAEAAAKHSAADCERNVQVARAELLTLQEQAAAAVEAAAAAERQSSAQAEAVKQAEGRLAAVELELEAAQARNCELMAELQQQAQRLQAAEQQAVERQAALASVQGRLEELQQQLAAAQATQGELQATMGQQAAALEAAATAAAEQHSSLSHQLAATAAERDAAARQLHRLQSEVVDAELLLASFLGGTAASGCSSRLTTPAASPQRAGSGPPPASPADAPEVAAAVQWLQQTASAQQQGGQEGGEPGSGPGTVPLSARGSRLLTRIHAVLLEAQRLQSSQGRSGSTAGGGGSSGGSLSPEGSIESEVAGTGRPLMAAGVAASPAASKLPLLSPVQSDTSSALIPAVHAGCAAPSATAGSTTPLSRRAGTAADEEPAGLQGSSNKVNWARGLSGGSGSDCALHTALAATATCTPALWRVGLRPWPGQLHSPIKCCSLHCIHQLAFSLLLCRQRSPSASPRVPPPAQAGSKAQLSASALKLQHQRAAQHSDKPQPVTSKEAAQQRRRGGGHPLQAFVRTAGLAGLAGAVAVQVLQQLGRRR